MARVFWCLCKTLLIFIVVNQAGNIQKSCLKDFQVSLGWMTKIYATVGLYMHVFTSIYRPSKQIWKNKWNKSLLRFVKLWNRYLLIKADS